MLIFNIIIPRKLFFVKKCLYLQHPVSPRVGWRDVYLIKRRFQASIFGSSNLANLNNLPEDGATRMSAWYINTMRVAMNSQSGWLYVFYDILAWANCVAYLGRWAMREPDERDKREQLPRFFVM